MRRFGMMVCLMLAVCSGALYASVLDVVPHGSPIQIESADPALSGEAGDFFARDLNGQAVLFTDPTAAEYAGISSSNYPMDPYDDGSFIVNIYPADVTFTTDGTPTQADLVGHSPVCLTADLDISVICGAGDLALPYPLLALDPWGESAKVFIGPASTGQPVADNLRSTTYRYDLGAAKEITTLQAQVKALESKISSLEATVRRISARR